jgi:predicted Zn-dependent peptidase
MKRMLSWALVTSTSWMGPLAIAQAPRPQVAAPPSFTLPRAIESFLPNGLALTLVPYGTLPTARVELVIRAGTVDEEGRVGIAELVGDYLREGSSSRNPDSLAREMSGLGVVGGEIGTLVRPFTIWVGGEVLSESTPALVELIGDLAQNPSFAPADLARLKANQVRRLSIRRTQPATLASTRINNLLFPDHPSDRIPTDEQVQGLTLDDVRRFHAAHFVARKAHLYIAGVFDGPAAEAAVRRAFGAWTAGVAKPATLDTPLKRGDGRANRPVIHLLHRPGASQARIHVSVPIVDPAHPDHHALELLNLMLGSVQTSRIIANVRERHGYSYNVSSRLVRRPGSSQWSLTADVASDVTAAALREILAELARLVTEPPPEEELHRHQAFMTGLLIAENASPAGILDSLRYFDLYGVDAEHRKTVLERVRGIGPMDIQRVARTYFQPRDLVIVVVGDRAAVAPQLASIGTLAD